jgi:hypothetical protein
MSDLHLFIHSVTHIVSIVNWWCHASSWAWVWVLGAAPTVLTSRRSPSRGPRRASEQTVSVEGAKMGGAGDEVLPCTPNANLVHQEAFCVCPHLTTGSSRLGESQYRQMGAPEASSFHVANAAAELPSDSWESLAH